MTYQGVIFDFNGVLLFDSHLHEAAWNTFAEKYRGQAFSTDEIRNHLHGRPNSYIIAYILDREVAGQELEALTDEKESMYRKMCLEQPETFILSPGAKDLLDFLKTHEVPRTIATASEITNLQFFFEHLKLSRWFEFNQCVWDSGLIRGKPYPDKFIIAAHYIKVHPHRAMVIEDSVSGAKAALAAGIGWVYGLGNNVAEAFADSDELGGVINNLEEFDRKLLEY